MRYTDMTDPREYLDARVRLTLTYGEPLTGTLIAVPYVYRPGEEHPSQRATLLVVLTDTGDSIAVPEVYVVGLD